MNILVTGGAGFIGSHLVDALQKDSHQVTVLDNLSSGLTKNITPQTAFIEGDICNAALVAKVFKENSFDAVFHLAAQIDVRASVADPLHDADINIVGSLHLIQSAAQSGVKKFIFSSSGGAIYGDTEMRPTPETHSENPLSPYGIGKLTIDKYLAFYEAQFGMQTVSLRYANVYGPRQNPHGEAGVVAIFLQKMLAGINPIINGDGEQTRDYVFVKDVAQANILALTSEKSGVYNIGTGVETSVNALFTLLNKNFGDRFTEEHGESKPGEQKTSSLNAIKAQQELSWQSTLPLEEGLKQTYEWFKNDAK
jgi:UDP-glucose 4-epimerase